MSFDVFAISALVDELNETLAGGRIQKVLDLDETAIGMEVYANRQRHYLVLNALPARPYAALLQEKLRRGLPKPTQLGLLLRRIVEGGIIDHVSQPPWERMLTLHIDSPEGVSELVFEAIERRANILLVQEGLILDCIRRVGAQDNRVRVSLPGRDYVPPPPQTGKTLMRDVAVSDITDALEAMADEQAWRALTRTALGMSPMLAREIVYQATGAARHPAGETNADTLHAVFQDLVGPLLERRWQPGYTQDDQGVVTGYAVYPLSYLPGWQATAGISEAIVAHYGAPVGEDAYNRAKEPVQAQLREAIIRVSKKAESLQQSLRTQDEMEELRKAGELLLAYQYTIQPGTTEFSAEYDPEGPPITIRLDASLSALDNAKHYFARYEKSKRALEDVPARLKAANRELDFLRQLETDLTLAASWPEIDEVRDALERDGYWRGARQVRPKSGKSAPLKHEVGGYVVWVGRNSRQNDLVTFSKGSAEDLWIHVRGAPGAHVIIKTQGRDVPEEVVLRAGELAAFYSAMREEGRVLVDVTERKHVRKIRGGKPGMVTYRNEETREVQPRGIEDN